MKKIIFLFFCVLFAGNAISYAQGQEKKLDKVSLQMSWFPYADYAPYVIGLKKGFYKEAGIDLSMLPGKGSELCVKLIGTRKVDFASASAETALIGRSKGVPVKFLAVMHQVSPVSIFSLAKIPLNKPSDMEGKTLASDLSSTKHKQFEIFCKLNKIDINKVKIYSIKGSDVIHLLNGSVDTLLMFGYIGRADLRGKGYKFHEIKLSDYGLDMYSIGLITNDQLIKENPDLVKRFVSATIKSWSYAIGHPEETAGAFMEYYPETKGTDQKIQVEEVIKLMQGEYTEKYGPGYQALEKWEKTQELLYNGGMLDKKIEMKGFFTNEFLPNNDHVEKS